MGAELIPTDESTVKMNRIATLRHGDYQGLGTLTPDGVAQMRRLGDRLKQDRTPEEGVLILSSTSKRAVESAKIISDFMEAPVEEHTLLWSQNSHPEDLPGAYELIQRVKPLAELVIVVTHLEYAEEFPSYLAKRDLNLDISPRIIPRGGGSLLDYRTRSLSLLHRC